MALPEGWDVRTIKGSRMDSLGNAAAGKIVFSMTAPRVKELTSKTVIFAKPREVILQEDGTFEVTLPVSTGDPDVVPHFQYDVLEQLTGAPDYKYTIAIDLSLPTSGEGYPFDLSDLMTVGNVPSGTTALTRQAADLLYMGKGENAEDPDALTLEVADARYAQAAALDSVADAATQAAADAGTALSIAQGIDTAYMARVVVLEAGQDETDLPPDFPVGGIVLREKA